MAWSCGLEAMRGRGGNGRRSRAKKEEGRQQVTVERLAGKRAARQCLNQL